MQETADLLKEIAGMADEITKKLEHGAATVK